MSFPKIVFGCGLDNYVGFDGCESGIVGLSSLHSQLAYDKFSYCLVPATGKFETSTMRFGLGSGDDAAGGEERVPLREAGCDQRGEQEVSIG